MANADKAFGYRFHSTLHGGPPRLTKYKNTAAIIYPGDIVMKDGSGRVNSITASSDAFLGVAASYVDATAGQDVYVYDDLDNTLFVAQADGADLADDTCTGNFIDTTVTTGDTTTLQSKQEIDSDTATNVGLEIKGLLDSPNNAWGEFAKIIVKLHIDSQISLAS